MDQCIMDKLRNGGYGGGMGFRCCSMGRSARGIGKRISLMDKERLRRLMEMSLKASWLMISLMVKECLYRKKKGINIKACGPMVWRMARESSPEEIKNTSETLWTASNTEKEAGNGSMNKANNDSTKAPGKKAKWAASANTHGKIKPTKANSYMAWNMEKAYANGKMVRSTKVNTKMMKDMDRVS